MNSSSCGQWRGGGTQGEGIGQGGDLTCSLEPVPTESGLRRPYASANAGSGHGYICWSLPLRPRSAGSGLV